MCVCVCAYIADSVQARLQKRREEMVGVGQIHFIPLLEARLGHVSVSAIHQNMHTCTACHTYTHINQTLTIMGLTAKTDKCAKADMANTMTDEQNRCLVLACGL